MSAIDWQRLRSVLADAPRVVAAWVFGSAQDGHVRAGGDLDIGVLFACRPSLAERAELRARLQEALLIDAIDLTVLNGASPIARFEAISGRGVFCRDPEKRAEFASLTAREYEDEGALLQWGVEMGAPSRRDRSQWKRHEQQTGGRR